MIKQSVFNTNAVFTYTVKMVVIGDGSWYLSPKDELLGHYEKWISVNNYEQI